MSRHVVILIFAMVICPVHARPPSPAFAKGAPQPATPIDPKRRVFTADEFAGLGEEQLSTYLKVRHKVLGLAVKDPSLMTQVREMGLRASTEPPSEWESDARRSPVGPRLAGILSMDIVKFLRLHALVSCAFDQYLATQSLKELELPTAASAPAKPGARPSPPTRQPSQIELGRIEDARKRLRAVLIPGFPSKLTELISRHERELSAALEETDPDDATLAPSDPTSENQE